MQEYISYTETELNTNGNAMTDDDVLFTKFDFDRKQTIENRTILETRFGFILFKSRKEGAYFVRDAKTGRAYGDLPKVALSTVWRKATRYLKSKKRELPVDLEVWEEAREKFETAIRGNDDDFGKTVFVQDVWQLCELDFIELGVRRANEVVDLMRFSVFEDIIETRNVNILWGNIRRRYPHRVKTALSAGGIFSDSDSNELSNAGIRSINAIRSQNIFRMKLLVPEHDFNNFPEQINRAYREDRARRRDFRYRVFPFLLGFIMLVMLIAIVYQYKYTLLKNFGATTANVVLLSIWASSVLFIAFSAVRAVFRRKKKRPEYRYFTKRVAVTAAVFGALSLFALLSVTVFYERYDGYNETLYYRNVSESEIYIAGLVDEDIDVLEIPSDIDGKQVVGIDLYAFYKDDFYSVKVDAELSEIAYGAFLKCDNLTTFDFGNSTLNKIGKNAFKDCVDLENILLPAEVEIIEAKAFKGCEALTEIVHSNPDVRITVGKEAFKNCSSLGNVSFLNNAVNIGKEAFVNTALTDIVLSEIENMGKNVFAECDNLETVQIPFIGENQDDLRNATYIFGKKCQIADIILTECDIVYKNMFKDMDKLESVTFVKPVNKIESYAFSGCKNLVYIDLEGVTEIGSYAFDDCTSLVLDELPESVEVIEENAFRNCDAINSLAVRGALTKLGEGAFRSMDKCTVFEFNSEMTVDEIPDDLFRDCTSLVYTNITDFVTSIGDDSFRNCDSLENIIISSDIKALGRRIFNDCDNLTSVTIPFSGVDRDSLKPVNFLFGKGNNIQTLHIEEIDEIYSKMFNNMDRLVSVSFGEQVSRIEKDAFRDCEKLSSIDLEGVTEIGNNAFRNCSALIIDEFPSSLKSIGKNAFRGCTALTEIVFNEALTSIGDYAFRNCGSLESVDLSASGIMTIPRGLFEGCVSLSTVNIGYNIDVVEARAFRDCFSLETLDLRVADSIGRDVCRGCIKLTSVYMPFIGPDRDTPKTFNYAFKDSGVKHLEITYMKKIPSRAFRGIDSLVSIKINADVEIIGKRAFEGSTSLTTLDINGVKVIKSCAFKNCNSLTEISEFDELEEMGSGVFVGCDGLETIKLPDSINHITRGMFKDSGFTEIVLSPYTHTIDKYAFENCSSLETIVIPSAVTEIEKGAFKGCGSLKIIDLSSTGLENIASETFKNCYELTEVRLPSSVETIGKRAFFNCDSLESINLGNISEIGKQAFEGSASLTQIDISSAKSIGKNAFTECYELAAVIFGNELEKIGANAFRNCDSLQSLIIPDSVEKIGRNAFAECDELTMLSVPFVGWSRGFAFKFKFLVGNSSCVSEVQISDAKKLARRAFKNTDIIEIYLNEGIEKIGVGAFSGCDNLRRVYMSVKQSEFRELFDENLVEIVYYD